MLPTVHLCCSGCLYTSFLNCIYRIRPSIFIVIGLTSDCISVMILTSSVTLYNTILILEVRRKGETGRPYLLVTLKHYRPRPDLMSSLCFWARFTCSLYHSERKTKVNVMVLCEAVYYDNLKRTKYSFRRIISPKVLKIL